MSASFYDLLKYAATGQASPSMTYYDRMRASTLMGGVVQTLTGIPPLSFKSNGKPLISWSMLGNGQQIGTPTPAAPITPTFCGVRTGNLFEGAFGGSIGTTGGIASSEQYDVYYAKVTAGETYTISGGYYVYAYYSDIPSVGTANSVDNTRHFTSQGKTFTVIEGAAWIGVRVNSVDKPMLNLGSTALPYEPFGWAEKITCAGQTQTVYLGQTQTVRRIRKLVLTGEEETDFYRKNVTSADNSLYYIRFIALPSAPISSSPLYCTHLQNLNHTPLTDVGINVAISYSVMYFNLGLDVMNAQPSGNTVAGLKEYLAQQYAAGTPVTVWYVLATPETGIVNEPLCKIGDYADELHSEDAAATIPTAKGQNTLTVETDLQPSEMTIKYRER